eukprot:5829397-Karenia_brevis.AAC.1
MYLVHKTGAPIGGPISGALLNMNLGASEYHATQKLWKEHVSHCGLNDPMSAHIAACRYEDDLFIGSLTVCACCIDAFVARMYCKAVPFEHNGDAEHKFDSVAINRFLDMRVTLSFDGVDIDLHHANLRAVLSNDNTLRGKFRFAPPIGMKKHVVERHAQNIMTRRS